MTRKKKDETAISFQQLTPRTRCSCTCSVSVFSRMSVSWGGLSWCFLRVAVTILFVFAGCIIISSESYQSATSLRLPWRAVSTNCIFFPLVWRDKSSANKLLLTLSFDMCSGKSLMNMQNRSGLNTEPWGTPYLISPFEDDSLLRKAYCVLFVRKEKKWVMKSHWPRVRAS